MINMMIMKKMVFLLYLALKDHNNRANEKQYKIIIIELMKNQYEIL